MQRTETRGMQKHLEEISRNVAAGAQALLILDTAGWHTAGEARAQSSREHRVILRQSGLSNRVFESDKAICEACCSAWNALRHQAGRIASIATRSWVAIGQSP